MSTNRMPRRLCPTSILSAGDMAPLLEWYRENKRDLPWRTAPDPYGVWVSEVMLQQTQVRTVVPFYRRFMRRFPDVRTLAAAGEHEVLAQWAGLGYYSRARNLLRAARRIAVQFEGRLPDKLETLLELPGVGRYIAGAILSIAFNQQQPIVDGNIRRVISRLHCLRDGAPDSFYWRQAGAWIPSGRASEFNQAVMELGALVCTPARPACARCPVSDRCGARLHGLQETIPRPRADRPRETVCLVCLVLERRGRVLLTRERDAGFIPGEWGFPAAVLTGRQTPLRAAQLLARRLLGSPVTLAPAGRFRHGITRRAITGHVFRAGGEALKAAPGAGRWFPRSQLDRLLISSAFQKAWRAARQG